MAKGPIAVSPGGNKRRSPPKAGAPLTAKRGRPTAAQVEAINRAIATAAAEHFLTVGYEASSMEAMAARAGVSKGTLYARYPTKRALLHAVVKDQVAAWSAASGRNDHLLPTGLEARLRYHAKTITRALANEEVRAFQELVRGSGISPDLRREFNEIGQGFVIRMLTEEIASGTRDDPVPARSPEGIAKMLFAMLYGWYSVEQNIGKVGGQDAVEFADRAIDVLFAGRAAW